MYKSLPHCVIFLMLPSFSPSLHFSRASCSRHTFFKAIFSFILLPCFIRDPLSLRSHDDRSPYTKNHPHTDLMDASTPLKPFSPSLKLKRTPPVSSCPFPMLPELCSHFSHPKMPKWMSSTGYQGAKQTLVVSPLLRHQVRLADWHLCPTWRTVLGSYDPPLFSVQTLDRWGLCWPCYLP